MNENGDLHTAHRMLDDACLEATGWLLQASALLQAGGVVAGLTGTLDLLGLLPQGYEADHQIDFVLLVATPILIIWGSRWGRAALAKPAQPTDGDD